MATMWEKLADGWDRRGLKQTDLERRLGLAENRIAKWKSGQGKPDPAQLLELARQAGVSLDWACDDLAPDDPPETKLPHDEEAVLRAYRSSRHVLDAAAVVDLIAEARGRVLGALEQQSLTPGVMRLEPRPIGQSKSKRKNNEGNSG